MPMVFVVLHILFRATVMLDKMTSVKESNVLG